MYIKSQKEKCVFKANRIFYTNDATTPNLYHVFVDGILFADYSTEQQARDVIVDVYNAIVDGTNYFEMPLDKGIVEGEVEVIVDETSQS